MTQLMRIFLLMTLILAIALTGQSASASAASAHSDLNSFGESGRDDPGFSMDIPWSYNVSGTYREGNITAVGDCTSFRLTWMRDPGIEPGDLIDLVASSYRDGGVTVISSGKGTALKNVSTMVQIYRFGGYEGRKRYAAWRSDSSDRLFFASLWSCEGNFSQDSILFNRTIESFSDIVLKVELQERMSRQDAWAVVLQDVLSSRRYSKPWPPGGSMMHIAIALETRAVNGVWEARSDESAWATFPQDIFVRPCAVQNLLRRAGYDTRLIQRHGKVWIVVADGDRWQAVSINPSDPGAMAGAAVNGNPDLLHGVLYRSAQDLALANGWSASIPDGYLAVRCEPSVNVTLSKASPDPGWLDGLNETLESQTYPERYVEGTFDCSNTSQICWAVLERAGYDASLMLATEGHPLGLHMWVIVRHDGGYVAVEATETAPDGFKRLGYVTMKDDYYFGVIYSSSIQYSMLNSVEGLWLEPSGMKER